MPERLQGAPDTHRVRKKQRLFSDTSPEAEQILIELYRRAPAWKKLRQVSELTRMVQELALCDIRRRHPHADEREEQLRLASRWLSPEIMRQVFGWNPEKEGY